MNLDSTLTAMQELRTHLETAGITQDTLVWTAVGAAMLFVLSLREVLNWYLRITHLRSDVRDLKEQIANLQIALQQTQTALLDVKNRSTSSIVVSPAASVASPEDSDEEASPISKAQFRLDH